MGRAEAVGGVGEPERGEGSSGTGEGVGSASRGSEGEKLRVVMGGRSLADIRRDREALEVVERKEILEVELKGERCNADGGVGIGAGHTCRCVAWKGHPPFEGGPERPHGCACGALW